MTGAPQEIRKWWFFQFSLFPPSSACHSFGPLGSLTSASGTCLPLCFKPAVLASLRWGPPAARESWLPLELASWRRGAACPVFFSPESRLGGLGAAWGSPGQFWGARLWTSKGEELLKEEPTLGYEVGSLEPRMMRGGLHPIWRSEPREGAADHRHRAVSSGPAASPHCSRGWGLSSRLCRERLRALQPSCIQNKSLLGGTWILTAVLLSVVPMPRIHHWKEKS